MKDKINKLLSIKNKILIYNFIYQIVVVVLAYMLVGLDAPGIKDALAYVVVSISVLYSVIIFFTLIMNLFERDSKIINRIGFAILGVVLMALSYLTSLFAGLLLVGFS